MNKLHSFEANMAMAERLAQRVHEAGGRAYFVGGFVRDRLRGEPGKDIDIEVHGLTPEALCAVLDDLGERLTMGASFGIYGLRHYDLDIAMPRRETATGRGHKDFDVFVDPMIGPEKAALRRDFTVNALMQDVLTGEVLDFFGGRADLEKGILRHVNDVSFAEDPLRVLRAAQFAARFAFRIAPETVALCRTMDLTALAKERIFGELEKALLKAEQPSIFFETLREMDQLKDWFPELQQLIGVQQDPRWHPEGDVWTHTMCVLDQAACLRDEAQSPMALMLAALCHDLGKAVSTTIEPDGRIRAIGHETTGVPLTEALLQRITGETQLLKTVPNLVALHMRPNLYIWQHSSKKAFMHLFDEAICPNDLLLLAKADRLGTGHRTEQDAAHDQALNEMLAAYNELMQQPQVRGADLLAAGMKPGKQVGEAVAAAHRMHLAGIPKEDALRQTLAQFAKEKHA